MGNNDWAKQYRMPSDHVDTTRGNSLGRIRPVGVENLKIGHIQPINNNPFSAQQHTIDKLIARYVPQGSGLNGEQNIFAMIYSPSSRLRGAVFITLEPDELTADDPAFVVTPTWRVRAVGRNPRTGRETPLQVAYPSGGGFTALTDAYEFDSASPIVRAEIVLQDTNLEADYCAANTGCNVRITATWEPNVDMTQVELARLYSLCSLMCPGALKIENNAT